MNSHLKVLYLSSDGHWQPQLQRGLKKTFSETEWHQTSKPDDFSALIQTLGADLLLLDYTLSSGSGLDAWMNLEHGPNPLPAILLVKTDMDEAEAVHIMRSGISECLPPEDFHRLGTVAQKLIELWEARQAKLHADEELLVSRQQLLRLTQQLHTRIDEERAAMSREIHDDIGGALAAVKFDLAWISKRIEDEEIKKRIDQAAQTLHQALEASQRIMHNLRPPILDEGLVPALTWLVTSFERRTQATVLLSCDRDYFDLPPDVQMVAFSVVREGLTNVIKHANATEVKIEVSELNGVFVLDVSDNGVGLSPRAMAKPSSLGLVGLRERAQSVGGWLDVSPRKQGVSLILTIPLDTMSVDTLDGIHE